MNAITSCYADLFQKESGWTDTPKKTLHIWLIGPILCLGRSLAIEPQNSYLSRNWTVFTPWKFLLPRSLLELVQLAIAFYDFYILPYLRYFRNLLINVPPSIHFTPFPFSILYLFYYRDLKNIQCKDQCFLDSTNFYSIQRWVSSCL